MTVCPEEGFAAAVADHDTGTYPLRMAVCRPGKKAAPNHAGRRGPAIGLKSNVGAIAAIAGTDNDLAVGAHRSGGTGVTSHQKAEADRPAADGVQTYDACFRGIAQQLARCFIPILG